MESSYIHSDIIYEILLRTSNVTLGRCRVVSKEWNQITYDSEFKKIHSQKTNLVDGFFVHDQFPWQYNYSFATIKDETHKISLDFILGYDVRIQAVSANNGIILWTSENFRQYRVPFFFMCKPRIKLFQQILNPRTRFLQKGMAIYVIHSNPFHYKILKISSPKLPFVNDCQNLILEVFDSEVWKWKRLKDIRLPCGVRFWSERSVVTASGAFHWVLYLDLILSFNIKKEEWKIICLPVVEEDHRSLNLVEYEGKLALMCMDMEDYMHTWVLESYRNLVWQKRFVINMKEPRCTYLTYSPLAFYSSDIIVVGGSWSLKYYDFKNEKIVNETKLKKHYIPDHIFPFWSDSEPCCLRRGGESEFQWWSRKRKKPSRAIGSMQPSPTL